jgi:rRNA maturation RNase YbeY
MVKHKPSKEPLPFSTNEIEFNQVDTFYLLKGVNKISSWISQTILSEQKLVGNISFNFCSDKYLLKVNNEHLQHDYYTDIITFDFCEGPYISGDIYISIERVKENAQSEKKPISNELHRVLIHGVLHLCGYKDKTPADARLMREKEDYYLSLLP